MKPYLYTAIIALLLGAAIGRYYTPTKTVTKTLDKTVTDHSVTTTALDGTRTTRKDVVISATSHQDTIDTKIGAGSQPRWEVGALGLLDPLNGKTPAYGAYIHYRLLGPVVVGGFGYLNGCFGGSVGIQF